MRNAIVESSPVRGGLGSASKYPVDKPGVRDSAKPKFNSQSRFDRSGYKSNY